MKKSKRVVALMLVLVTLISILTVTASASNYGNTNFYNFTLREDQRFLNTREKQDDTPCYVRVNNALINQVIHINAFGYLVDDKEATTLRGHCTRDGYGQYQEFVSILPYQDYRIRNMINEFGYPYASLGFSSPSDGAFQGEVGNEVSGVWSPDSLGNYQYAYKNIV